MMKVEAVIPPHRFEAVRAALDRRGVAGLTVSEALGFGHEPARQSSYRGSNFPIVAVPRLRLEIVTSDAEAGPIADDIARAARTGDDNGGFVSIVPVRETIRVRTGERGASAVGGYDDAEAPANETRRAPSAEAPQRGGATDSRGVPFDDRLLPQRGRRWFEVMWRRR